MGNVLIRSGGALSTQLSTIPPPACVPEVDPLDNKLRIIKNVTRDAVILLVEDELPNGCTEYHARRVVDDKGQLPLDASYNFRVGDALSFTPPYSEVANDPFIVGEDLVFYQTIRE